MLCKNLIRVFYIRKEKIIMSGNVFFFMLQRNYFLPMVTCMMQVGRRFIFCVLWGKLVARGLGFFVFIWK